jgi:hypothetical protein
MKHHLTQLAVRENTALSRPHASRLSTDVRSNSICIKEQDPHTRLSASRNEPSATDSGNPSHTASACAATGGERGDGAEHLSVPATIIAAKESSRVRVTPEPFVSADEAAQFLCVKRRYLLELARRGIAGAYALGTGGKRKVWVFRLSELAASVVRNKSTIPKPPEPCTIGSGSPR